MKNLKKYVVLGMMSICLTGCKEDEVQIDTEKVSIETSGSIPVITTEPTAIKSDETETVNESLFPESRIGFYSNGYWGMDIKAIDNDAKTVTYDGYEYAVSRELPVCQDRTASIVDADTLIASDITIPWTENSFTLTGTYDSAFMSSGAGSGHDYEHGPGTYVRCEKPISSDTAGEQSGESWEYILPDSSRSYLTDGEISTLTDDELQMAINEIYARHGRRFQDSGIQAYFDEKSWYLGTTDPDSFDESVLSDVELTNIQVLSAYIGGSSAEAASTEEGKQFFRNKEGYYTNPDTYQIVRVTAYENSSTYDGLLIVAKNVRSSPDTAGSEYYNLRYDSGTSATIIDEKKGQVLERGTVEFYDGGIYITWDTGYLTGDYPIGVP